MVWPSGAHSALIERIAHHQRQALALFYRYLQGKHVLAEQVADFSAERGTAIGAGEDTRHIVETEARAGVKRRLGGSPLMEYR